ncbi:MAG: MoxR family ATPase [Myxococcota bacterium]
MSDIVNLDTDYFREKTELVRARVAEIKEAREKILVEVRKRIVGQDDIVEKLLIALFSRGHSLLVGVPGLAKTLLISTLSEALNLSFNRIQFTPDLMPSDITGTDIIEEDPESGARRFRFIRGPIFANIVLADEINRTPPKTQAALLQAMQELAVTAGGKTYKLAPPFLVFATQNPIEQEGTYPLPEAQLDRFMFFLTVNYPSALEELEIIQRTTSAPMPSLEPALTDEKIVALQDLVLNVPVAEHILRFVVELVRKTRPEDSTAPKFVKEFVGWGAGPRAGQYLILGGKARALLSGRFTVSEEDILALAEPVLTHRIIVNFSAEAEGVKSSDIIKRLLDNS